MMIGENDATCICTSVIVTKLYSSPTAMTADILIFQVALSQRSSMLVLAREKMIVANRMLRIQFEIPFISMVLHAR